jgi:enterochelin esterase family protein
MQVVVRSILYVPGAAFMDERNVPHGAVSEVNYYSTVLGKFRKMHVYTPPGYERSSKKHPVLYLMHGANESDDSWHSVGRVSFILDNLIADGKAVPMIVVMPNGHTDQTPPLIPPPLGIAWPLDRYPEEFEMDIMPFAESHYRILTDRPHRAIAGLSMGGSQTLNIAFAHLDRFSAIGVFSSGSLPGYGGPADTWEVSHLKVLDDPRLKKGLKMLWFSTGLDDSLLPISKTTVAMLQGHGFQATFQQSAGAHTWVNWRNYLYEMVPQLFR